MRKRRTLSAKLVGVQIVFLAIALASIGLTLLVSWRLEGSAAAINDAGSLRMRTYRMAYLAEEARADPGRAAIDRQLISRELREFEDVVGRLRTGDPRRPLFVPDTGAIRAQFAVLDREWAAVKPSFAAVAQGGSEAPGRARVERFVEVVNELVARLEKDIAHTINLLRAVQLGLMALAIAGATALIYLSFLFIIRPVRQIEGGLDRIARGDLAARVPVESTDELAALANGFNRMAAQIGESYRTLETRVEQKTRSLAQQNARLATLYDMTAFLNEPAALEELCRGFLKRLAAATGATAGAVRLLSREDESLHLIADESLPDSFRDAERCLAPGECACGDAAARNASVIHDLAARSPVTVTLPHCRDAGFATATVFPINAQRQRIGVYNLFFRERRTISREERHMLESVGQHLGVAIENLRLVSRERELAASEERSLLAQELHDSIAQSLAFLNLQVQMLRRTLLGPEGGGASEETRRVLDELQLGVQESYADVRELLVHFRTPTAEGDVEHAIRTLLARFERQTGVKTAFKATGSAVPLAPDDQLQVMHILQEALSNVRKHAHARSVQVELQRAGGHNFRVRDDGCGFDAARRADDAADHVGLRIMSERAQRVGGKLEVRSQPGQGTEVVLSVPVGQREAA